MISATEALRRLQKGNAFFAANQFATVETGASERQQHLDNQNPFAIILGCSDSRVPVELIFNQGLGDLFVIRVAGNVVAPSQIGSVEYAAATFDTPLVVVLGHTHCGAVQATIEQLRKSSENRSPNLQAIVDRISPAVKNVLALCEEQDDDSLLRQAVRANIHASVENLVHGSTILEAMVANDELTIVGAEYCLKDGTVEFL